MVDRTDVPTSALTWLSLWRRERNRVLLLVSFLLGCQADAPSSPLATRISPPAVLPNMTTKAGPSYASLAKTEFFSFFGVKEIGREPRDKHTVVHLKTGGFPDRISIDITITGDEYVEDACLVLAQDWIGGDANINPFANDLAKSFLELFHSPVDQDQMIYFIEALWKQAGPNDKVIKSPFGKVEPDIVIPPDTQTAIAVYRGHAASFASHMRGTDLSFDQIVAKSLGGARAVRICVHFRAVDTSISPPSTRPAKRDVRNDLMSFPRIPETVSEHFHVTLLNRDLATPKDVSSASGRGMVLPRTLLLSAVSMVIANNLPSRAAFGADIFDGATAHSIVLVSVNDSLTVFEYIDPWGDRSFLEAANNVAGVAARSVRPRRWQLSAGELARVLYDISIPAKELSAVVEFARRLESDEVGVMAEYRTLPYDSYPVSEQRLARLALAFASAGNLQAGLALARINVYLHPASAEASRSLARVGEAARE